LTRFRGAEVKTTGDGFGLRPCRLDVRETGQGLAAGGLDRKSPTFPAGSGAKVLDRCLQKTVPRLPPNQFGSRQVIPERKPRLVAGLGRRNILSITSKAMTVCSIPDSLIGLSLQSAALPLARPAGGAPEKKNPAARPLAYGVSSNTPAPHGSARP
jgi:hypothetical protein